jgi:basic membrane protein A and related proteins
MIRSHRALLGLAVATALAATACGSSSGSSGAGTTAAAAVTTAAASATTAGAATTAASATTAGAATTTGTPLALDTNGDGKVVVGVATPGPRNDGAYYQALVDGITKFSKDNKYADPIIVDNIKAEEAATQLDSLARQNVDMIAVGAGELGDPLKDLTAKYGKIIWYCNCGAGHEVLPNLIQSGDDGSEISFTAGYATGLLLKAKGKNSAAMIGNNNFNFEQEAFQAMELGLKAVDPTFTWTYVPTGSFNDVAAATEAFNNLKSKGIGAIYPYLGGAHEAVVKLAGEAGVIVMSAGASKACDRTDLKYDIAVRFDAGDYLDTILGEIKSGKLQRGQTRAFKVGVDPQPGAVICKPTAEQTTAMQGVYKDIAANKYGDQFFALKKAIYKF